MKHFRMKENGNGDFLLVFKFFVSEELMKWCGEEDEKVVSLSNLYV